MFRAKTRTKDNAETQRTLRRRREKYTPPWVFLQKSLDLLDYKGVDLFRDDKEFARVSNDEV